MCAKRIVVAIADANASFRDSFARSVQADSLLQLAGTAADRTQAEKLLASAQPADVLVVDPEFVPGTLSSDILRQACARHTEILVVTGLSDDRSVVTAIECGAAGYILKTDSTEQVDLTDCIKLLVGGGSPVSPTIARSVLRAIRDRTQRSQAPQNPPAGHEPSPLSARETEILGLLAKGMSFNKIGEILSVSPHTVTAHIKKIYRKLQVHSRGEAVYEASQMGLLDS